MSFNPAHLQTYFENAAIAFEAPEPQQFDGPTQENTI